MLRNALRLKMPKTSENIKLIQEGNRWLAIFHHGSGYRIAEDEDELRALALTMRGIFNDKLKEAEKRIADESEIVCIGCQDCSNEFNSACDIADHCRNFEYKIDVEKAKQILNECFGVRK